MEENNVNEVIEIEPEQGTTETYTPPTPAMLLHQLIQEWHLSYIDPWVPKVYAAAYNDFIDKLCEIGYLQKNN